MGCKIPSSLENRAPFASLLERAATYILSLVLALVVWIVAINEQNPLVQDFYQNSVPIEVRGPDEGLSPRVT